MKKRGFTLVELLAVIVIIATISLITTISVTSIISKSKLDLLETQIKNIEKSAEAYYIEEGMYDGIRCINVEDLIKNGYIKSDTLKDFTIHEEINGSVIVTELPNRYTYTYQAKACPKQTCDLYDKNGNNKIDVLEEVTCGTESFYVIPSDPTAHPKAVDGNITLFAKYNLNVGNDLAPGEEGIQNSGAIGMQGDLDNFDFTSCNFTEEEYNQWLSVGLTKEKNIEIYNSGYGCNGTLPFSETQYWGNDEVRTFIYNEDSLLYDYVEDYRKYLQNDLGVEVEEASIPSFKNFVTDKNAIIQIGDLFGYFKNTGFWTGRLDSIDGLNVGAQTTSYYVYHGGILVGVRPIIVIPQYIIRFVDS